MTERQAPDTRPAGKLLGTRALKIRIALASAALLAVGAALAPQPTPAGEAPRLGASEERAAPLLEERVQRREESRPFLGVHEVAARVRDQVVAIPGSDEPRVRVVTDYAPTRAAGRRAAGFGVRVSATHVITHAWAMDGRPSVPLSAPGGGETQGALVAYDRPTGLALLQAPSSSAVPATVAQTPALPGALALHVGRRNGGDEAGPVFVISRDGERYGLGPPGDALLPGTPIFNAEGHVVALAGGGGEAVAVAPGAARLFAIAQSGPRISAFGLALQALAGPLTTAFGERGVLVADVVAGGPAQIAGVRPGDVLLAVNATEVTAVDAAAAALAGVARGATASLRLRRSGGERTVEAAGASPFGVDALARQAPAAPPAAAPTVGALISLPLLPGVPPATRLVGVNGRPVASLAEAERELRRARRPVTLWLDRDGQRFFAALEPAR